jgi:hypothetical protein
MTNANLMHDAWKGRYRCSSFLSRLQSAGNVRSNLPQKLQRMHGSELLACQTCFEQIIDHQQYL